MSDTEEESRVIHSLGSRQIVAVKDKVIKSGLNLRRHEARNLQFIAENTTIPVPRVHDIHCQDGTVRSIVMNYMPGKPLDKVWPHMTHDEKDSVAQELRSYITQLRRLKGDYIGAADRGKVVIGEYSPHEGGPFDSEQLFNEFLFSHIIPSVPEPLRYYGTCTFEHNHEIVFTHGDLAPRNILVDEQYHVTAILDWENAGWYPEYWEHVRAYRDFNATPDWSAYLSIILPPQYAREYLAMSFLAHISR